MRGTTNAGALSRGGALGGRARAVRIGRVSRSGAGGMTCAGTGSGGAVSCTCSRSVA